MTDFEIANLELLDQILSALGYIIGLIFGNFLFHILRRVFQ